MTPAMRPNCRSRGVATEEAMISGLAPGKLRRNGDRREIDLGQRRYGQEIEGHGAGKSDGHGKSVVATGR